MIFDSKNSLEQNTIDHLATMAVIYNIPGMHTGSLPRSCSTHYSPPSRLCYEMIHIFLASARMAEVKWFEGSNLRMIDH